MSAVTVVKASAPATVANVACGFDVLGFALNAPCDEIVLTRTSDARVTIASISGDDGKLPLEPEKNTAAVAIRALFESAGVRDFGVSIALHKGLPLGSGLGSSAASSAAALVAANAFLPSPRSLGELLPFAMEGERVACGAAHADNVAPALFGGFVLIRSYEPLDVIELPVPEHLYCVIAHPAIELRTSDSRQILRKQIPLVKAVKQWGNVGGLVAGLYRNDYALISRSLHDEIIEPERALLIPGFHAAKKNALEAGALGCSVSGSGPSVFALCEGVNATERIGAALAAGFASVKLRSDIFASRVNGGGAAVLERDGAPDVDSIP